MSKFSLGKTLRDTVSGFEGVAVARVEYLNGCIQYCIQPPAKDGRLPDGVYLDEHQLVEIGEGVSIEASGTGGPSRHVPPAAYRG